MKRGIAIGCFFLSGAAGLIYEVCWIRRASLVFGSTTHALSTVLAVFFLGLAAGSYLFGRISQRTTRPLRIYAAVELALAALALASLPLFGLAESLYGHAYRSFPGSAGMHALARIGLVGMVVYPPTLLMGATLPLFCRQFVLSRGRIAGSVGFLYGVNTLGAAVGCALTGLVLIPSLGMQKAIALGAVLNAVAGIAVGALRLSREVPPAERATPGKRPVRQALDRRASARQMSVPTRRQGAAPAPEARRDSPTVELGARTFAALVFLAGFVALGHEVLWARYLGLIVRNTVYTYTMTLTVVLVGIVIGSVIASRLFDPRLHRATIFGALQMLVGLSVLATMLLPPAFWRGLGEELKIYSLLLLPAATLSGATFPLAVRMLVEDPELAGLGVGKITALNTLGGIAGSLALGFIALPSWGLETSLLGLTAVSLATGGAAWLLLERSGSRRWRVAAAAACLLAWLAIPRLADTRVPSDFLAGRDQLVAYREGLQSNLAVVRREGVLFMEIDRWWQGQTRKTHQIMAAHLPMLLHPRPRRVLVVGAGAGQTPSRIPMYDIERLDCVDIEPAVFDLIRSHFDSDWMDDPRVRLIREDGRNLIVHTDERYDVISLEIGQIFRPGVAPFYTLEFYRRARERLRPGGIISQFVPISFLSADAFRGVIATFLEIFPASTLWYNTSELLLVGVNADRFELDASRLTLLGSNPRVHEDLRYSHWGGSAYWLNRPGVFLAGFLAGPEGLRSLASGAPLHRDDLPGLEYETSRVGTEQANDLQNVGLLRAHLEPVEGIGRPALPTDSAIAIREIRDRNLGQIVSNALLKQLETVDRYEDAVAVLTRALSANPDNAKANRLMAETLASRGRFPEAEAHFTKVIAMRPEDGLAHRGFALLLQRQGRVAEAVPHYRAALALGAGDAESYNNFGAALEEQGDLNGALRHYEEALRLRAGFFEALKNRERVRAALRAAPR